MASTKGKSEEEVLELLGLRPEQEAQLIQATWECWNKPRTHPRILPCWTSLGPHFVERHMRTHAVLLKFSEIA